MCMITCTYCTALKFPSYEIDLVIMNYYYYFFLCSFIKRQDSQGARATVSLHDSIEVNLNVLSCTVLTVTGIVSQFCPFIAIVAPRLPKRCTAFKYTAFVMALPLSLQLRLSHYKCDVSLATIL